MKLNNLIIVCFLFSAVFVLGCVNVEVSLDNGKSCSELNGYMCDSEEECVLELLDSTESYCCPIKCNSCPSNFSCDDNDSCTNDFCIVSQGEPVCNHTQITPCANNGVCESGEIETCDFSSGSVMIGNERITGPVLCCPEYANAVSSKTMESDDCPESCDDEDPNTADWYNFTAQECQHLIC